MDGDVEYSVSARRGGCCWEVADQVRFRQAAGFAAASAVGDIAWPPMDPPLAARRADTAPGRPGDVRDQQADPQPADLDVLSAQRARALRLGPR